VSPQAPLPRPRRPTVSVTYTRASQRSQCPQEGVRRRPNPTAAHALPRPPRRVGVSCMIAGRRRSRVSATCSRPHALARRIGVDRRERREPALGRQRSLMQRRVRRGGGRDDQHERAEPRQTRRLPSAGCTGLPEPYSWSSRC
jgi:hypothetical protein